VAKAAKLTAEGCTVFAGVSERKREKPFLGGQRLTARRGEVARSCWPGVKIFHQYLAQ